MRIFFALVCTLLLISCGGGGGSSNDGGGGTVITGDGDGTTDDGSGTTDDGDGNTGGEDPFGLTQRPTLANFAFPASSQGGGGSDTISLTSAYTNLSFSAPVFAAQVPGDNRIAVIEQGGRVIAFTDSPGVTDSRVILDLSATVLFSGEQGLLGLAFDPQFVNNGYVYLHYSVASPARSIISRFTWDATQDLILESTEKVILENPQPQPNHNGGMLAFGPDNYLYIAFGDGGGAGDPDNLAQDRTSLHGKILRLDVHPANDSTPYLVPNNNPFVGQANVLPEIYAYGLRNPFRFSFDAQTGALWLGDVGQSEREEVNMIEAGNNYGWRVFEGTLPFNSNDNTLPDSAFTPPVFEYDHSEGRSVIGGYVYRGNQISSLTGKYVYGDYVSSTIWALTWNGSAVTQREALGTINNPTGFGQKANGELLIVSRVGDLYSIDGDGTDTTIPTLLSTTALFTDLTNLTPAGGLIEYTVNHPFYSDGVQKRRWVGIPNGQTVSYSSDDWQFPTGSVVVKHFQTDTPTGQRHLETRVLVLLQDGWLGVTYKWNQNQTDATLQLDRELENITVRLADGTDRNQTYEYPSRTDCFVCHTDVSDVLLGLRTPQLNGDFNYSGTVDNQLRSWNNISLFDIDIPDPTTLDVFPAIADQNTSLESRARTYLDVNCAQCHQPGGPTQSNLDFRYQTQLSGTNALDVAPSFGDLGAANARIIAAGAKESSVLWLRINRRDADQMPPLGSHVIDDGAVTLVGDWIDNM